MVFAVVIFHRYVKGVRQNVSGTKNRARLLLSNHIFHKKTDEQHPLSLNELKDRL
ncbi:hypothetical protein Alches_02310 [Alicyclobacillus hesperidum subsp. aegles]|nr:hypothetical protein Alches_02310 [Alicyclobacillus hesperidum subsp. aegles]